MCDVSLLMIQQAHIQHLGNVSNLLSPITQALNIVIIVFSHEALGVLQAGTLVTMG